MKIFCLITTILSVILTGCSSTYTVRDFPSKEELYKDFNAFVKDKNVKITLTDDSTFITGYNTNISNDSLVTYRVIKKENIIPANKIKSISYNRRSTNFANLSVKILFKDGEEMDKENIELLSDSSVKFSEFVNTSDYFPLDKVKEVSYKRRWLGIPLGLFDGIVGGTIVGATGVIPANDQNGNEDNLTSAVYGALAGIIIGPVVGWFIGYNYTYQFTP